MQNVFMPVEVWCGQLGQAALRKLAYSQAGQTLELASMN